MTEGEVRFLNHKRTKDYNNGMVAGALDVIFELDLDDAERIMLLSRALDISSETSDYLIGMRLVVDRIDSLDSLTPEEKYSLSCLMGNIALMDDKTFTEGGHDTLSFLSGAMEGHGGEFLRECIPEVDLWAQSGETVTGNRIRNLIMDRYGLR